MMRMRTTLPLIVALAACHRGATSPPDARDFYVCAGPYQTVQCVGGTATGRLAWDRSTSRTRACPEKDRTTSATCAQGCAVEASRTTIGTGDPLVDAPSLLCAETPAAAVGDPCGATRPCLPTRATLAADGTVTGQTYLACGAGGTCVAAAAPTIDRYLQACDASTIATYGVAGATGIVDLGGGQACLIAWDAAAGAPTSGVTRACVGDWECPISALCDDRLVQLTASAGPIAVCKPGPRGSLTPAMLAR